LHPCRIESLLPDPNVATAQAIFATLVGTLQLARTVSDAEQSDQLLEAGQVAALSLARASRASQVADRR
jgi:TetR/AcrR family transcriptional regulator, transcriptional repressor for nem operon